MMVGSTSRLAQDWLEGIASVALTHNAKIGLFDPGANGTANTSPFGAATSLVNPWIFILMMEGLPWFSSAPARRLHSEAHHDPRAAMTFMTHGDAAGTTTGSPNEESRGEVWFPWWERPLRAAAVRQLFTEGRAVWRGRTATRSDQMYLATAAQGVSPAIGGFDRYSIQQRNGTSHTAVLADRIRVRHVDAVAVVADVEDWMNILGGKQLPTTVKAATRRFDIARIDLVRANSARLQATAVAELLGSVTAAELAVGRSGRTREDINPWPRPREARRLVDLLAEPSWEPVLGQPEFRVALGIASIVTPPLKDAPRGRTMRELLLPIDPPLGRIDRPRWRSAPVVPGLGQRKLIDVLADLTTWLVVSAPTMTSVTEHGQHSTCGVTLPRSGVRVPWTDVHAWANGLLRDERIDYWLHALVALDWRSQDLALPETNPSYSIINPTLALLMPFRTGMNARRPTEHDASVYGLQPLWVGLLNSGHADRAHTAVRQRLRQLGYDAVSRTSHTGRRLEHGRRLTAALLPISNYQDALRHVADRFGQDDRSTATNPAKENA
jgi:CRISPR-associated protein Csx17